MLVGATVEQGAESRKQRVESGKDERSRKQRAESRELRG
jgi:hypothetical protein